MTEQQPQSPIDDLFRNAFENLPNTPAESGWDTPSDRVWQHVQANIQQPRKGWGPQSIILLAVFSLALVAALYWMFAPSGEKPATTPVVTPVEQPVLTPTATENAAENQPAGTPKSSTGNNNSKASPGKPTAPHNTTEENKAKPEVNTAQPLPGSKPTLPPNTTEAQKKKNKED